jgi:hypothetical protein
MAKFASQAVQDAPLDVIVTATEMYICNGQPTDRADAIAKARHASAIVMAGGDYAKTTSSGNRVLTVTGKNVVANSTGTVDHLALATSSSLLYVTTGTAQTANSGSSITVANFTVTATALV